MRENQWKRMGKVCLLQPLAMLGLMGVTVGCGSSSEFSGSSRTVAPPTSPTPATPATPPTADAVPQTPPAKLESLIWYWECTSNTSGAPKPANAQNPVIIGQGTHQLPYDNLPAQVPISFNGTLCPATSQPRDIVFVVDVSGSMRENDPLSAGSSCGRLDAVDGMVKKYADATGDAQFAIVTFDNVVRYQSSQFYTSRDSLYSGMTSPSDVLCAAQTGTYYDIPLTEAKTLLEGGRANATKEIYFISDGEPEPGHTGTDIAATLKDPGVTAGGKTIKTTIATIMLKGDDTVMASQIASRDQKGNALAASVTDADQLAATLASLASTYIIRAELRYRVAGTDAWQTIDIMKDLKPGSDLTFQIPPVLIDTQKALQGIEVQYQYWTNNGQSVESDGELSWKISK